MKRKILLLGMLLTFNAFAQSEYMSGNDLLKYCKGFEQNVSTFSTGLCSGYVSGAADSMARPTSGTRACIPPGEVTVSQLVAISVKYLRANPEYLHFSAYTNVAVALSSAFPCKK